MAIIPTVISGVGALWKIVTDLLARANETKKANLQGLTDYIDAARVAVSALALEGQEIVAEALAVTPASDDAAIQGLRLKVSSYLVTDDNRPKLEIALAGIKKYQEFLNNKNETVSDWPLGDAATRADVLLAVQDLLKKLEDFLRMLAFGGMLNPTSGLSFIQSMEQPIKDSDRIAIRESALKALQDPSYHNWRRLVVECEEIVGDLKLKFR